MAGLMVENSVGVISMLGVAYGVVLGVVVLVTGWELLSQRVPGRRRRGGVLPLVGAIARDGEGAR